MQSSNEEVESIVPLDRENTANFQGWMDLTSEWVKALRRGKGWQKPATSEKNELGWNYIVSTYEAIESV